MMDTLPDFEGLALFAKVVEERSLAAAARALNTSVSTVSRGVSRLEERLGARLFNRTSRQLALTEFGISVAEAAIKLLRDAEAAENMARELSASPLGRIRLAVPMSFGLRWIGPLMPTFLNRYPGVSVDLHLSDDSVDLIGQGFDAAVRIADLPDSSLVARRIRGMRRYIVAAPGWVKEHGEMEHPSELDGRSVLGYAYRAGGDVWRLSNASGNVVTIVPHGRLRVTNVDALIPTVLSGAAVCELPEFIAAQYLADGRLVPVLPQWHLPEGGLYFVSPSGRARPAKVDVLANYLVDCLSEVSWTS